MGSGNVISKILIAVGAMLLSAALLLVAYNFYREGKSEHIMEDVLVKLEEKIPEEPVEEGSPFDVFEKEGYDRPHEESSVETEEEAEEEAEDEGIELDGRIYIGTIEFPVLEQKFPVIKSWSYPDMNVAPCVYDGARVARNLIICSHNYRGFFDRIQELGSGDEVIFTDINGHRFTYEVQYSELIPGSGVELMYRGARKDWDMTLFTCTWSGYSRVTVRLKLIDN